MTQRVVAFDLDVKAAAAGKAEELSGKMESQPDVERLAHSVMQNDKQTIDNGQLLADAMNRGLGAFTPDTLFEKLVSQYSFTEQMLGERLLRLLTGYSGTYLERNVRIPEFRKVLKKELNERIQRLKDNGLLDNEGSVTDEGLELAAMVSTFEELDHLLAQGFIGDKPHHAASQYGEHGSPRTYKRGDRYRDISIRDSIRMAARRGHQTLAPHDLKTSPREARGEISLVYALDASASMKGDKLAMAKKAGIALAYSAIAKKDKVGLIVFGSSVRESIVPTNDFMHLARKMVAVSAYRETNFVKMIEEAVQLFPSEQITKHLMLITDALPTAGDSPEKDTLEAVSLARAAGITVSIVGIQLDKQGRDFAKQIAVLGEGRLLVTTSPENVDTLVLEDYNRVVEE